MTGLMRSRVSSGTGCSCRVHCKCWCVERAEDKRIWRRMVDELGDAERRAMMAEIQHDPEPIAGYAFWELAMPDIEAAFWAARRRVQQS